MSRITNMVHYNLMDQDKARSIGYLVKIILECIKSHDEQTTIRELQEKIELIEWRMESGKSNVVRCAVKKSK